MPYTKAEYRLLEVAIYDLKTKNKELQKALDAVIEDRDSYHEENNKLRKELDEATRLNQAISMLASLPRADEMDTLVKDGKRLDWIFRNCCVEFDGFHKDSFSSRKEVDEAMQAEEE